MALGQKGMNDDIILPQGEAAPEGGVSGSDEDTDDDDDEDNTEYHNIER